MRENLSNTYYLDPTEKIEKLKKRVVCLDLSNEIRKEVEQDTFVTETLQLKNDLIVTHVYAINLSKLILTVKMLDSFIVILRV